MGPTQPAAASPGVAGRAGRPAGEALPPRSRGWDPLRGAQWVRAAGAARRFPALAHRLRDLPAVDISGALAVLHGRLREHAREAAGRASEPTAAVIDSQSVRAAPTVARTSRGQDNAKKVNGRKRHIAVDTTGLLLDVVVTPASTQDHVAPGR